MSEASSSKIVPGSDRSFGLTFAAVFLLIGLFPWVFGTGPIRIWALAVALALTIVAVTIPWTLSPLNKIWFRFGLLLHRVISPVVMGLIFVVGVVPLGLIMRGLGKDLLLLNRDKNAQTYWIRRSSATDPKSMIDPF